MFSGQLVTFQFFYFQNEFYKLVKQNYLDDFYLNTDQSAL